MKVAVAYTAVSRGPLTTDFCAKFVASWHEFPPLVSCDLLVISNGGPISTEQTVLFSSLKARMFPRSNNGRDLGGYFEAARGPCAGYDAVLWLGESNYFHRAGWLKRLVEAWEKHGAGLYGPYSSNLVRGHLNTTAFFCAPSLLNLQYWRASTLEERYSWEHGPYSFWRWVSGQGMPVRLVTWDGEWPPIQWRRPVNILWRGDQSNLLMHCNHTERWANATPEIKALWSTKADGPLR